MKTASREWLIRSAWLVTGFGAGWGVFHLSGSGTSSAPTTASPSAFSGPVPVASARTNPENRPPASVAGGAPTAGDSQGTVRARFEAALRLPKPRRRLGAFLRQLDSLTAAEAPAVQQLIHDLNREGLQLPEEWEAFIHRWGELDGGAAAQHALSKSGEPWVGRGLMTIMSGWASKDPAAAAAWLNAHGDNPHFDQAMQGIVSGMAETDPAAATQVALSSLPEGNRPMASSLMEQLAESVVRTGKNPAMLEWFEALPVDANGIGIKNAAFGHVWWRLQAASLDDAATWLASNADKPWRNDRQYGETTAIMAQKDPVAALDWAGSLPPSPVDGRWPGVNSTLRNWIAQDAAAAAAYANSQPATPFGDYVRQAHASALNPPPPTPR